MQIHTLPSYGEYLLDKAKSSQEETSRESCFVLLQLVNALKTLQAQGIEELPASLNTFVLGREMEKEVHFKLFVLQG